MQIVIILRKILNTALSYVSTVSILQFSEYFQLSIVLNNFKGSVIWTPLYHSIELCLFLFYNLFTKKKKKIFLLKEKTFQ